MTFTLLHCNTLDKVMLTHSHAKTYINMKMVKFQPIHFLQYEFIYSTLTLFLTTVCAEK